MPLARHFTPAITREEYRADFHGLALAAVNRGEFKEYTAADPEHVAGIVANYAATDMLLQGRTALIVVPEPRENDVLARYVARARELAAERRAA